MLTVKECVPFFAFSHHPAAQLRTSQVASFGEALSLSWIRRLPGEKRVRFFCGQAFVIQRYLGSQLIRAQICHGQEQPSEAATGKVFSCDNLVSAIRSNSGKNKLSLSVG
jgi:hypothetical protein